jgi:ABC-type transport system involved in multi-copper enzyme maturation permease subunit
MSPAAEVLLVAQRELRKNVRSAKGLALLALSLLVGVVVALVLAFFEVKKRELIAGRLATLPPEAVDAARAAIEHEIVLAIGDGDEVLGEALSKAPGALLGALKFMVWFGPALVALLGFDAISGELQHRTVRYWTVRTRRTSFYVGKVLGLWIVVSALTLLVQLLTWAIVIWRGTAIGSVVEWGPRLWLVTLPLSLVWCALAQLVGSQFRSPILSLLTIFGSFFVLWIAYLLGLGGRFPAGLYLYPNAFDTWLLYPQADRLFAGLGICLGSAALYTAAGAAIFAQRDV